MIKKTDLVKQAVANGDFKKALRIAKDFKLNVTKEQKDAMGLAYECMIYPKFYMQLGKDIRSSIEEGKSIVVAMFGA